MRKEALFLHYVMRLSESERKYILRHLTKPQCRAVAGIIFNGLKKTFPIKLSDVKKIKKYKTTLYLIVNKNTNFEEKTKLLAQRAVQVAVILKAALKWIPIR